mgnify:CR=1 FL=1
MYSLTFVKKIIKWYIMINGTQKLQQRICVRTKFELPA